MKVATWNSAWFVTFIHEYNHFKQWKKGTKLWSAAENLEFFEDFDPKHVLSVQLMEQECDKMSWKDIKKYNQQGEPEEAQWREEAREGEGEGEGSWKCEE